MKEYIEKAAVKDEILSWAVCINHPELSDRGVKPPPLGVGSVKGADAYPERK